MGKLTPTIFNESCCDGGDCGTGTQSAQPCGCDPGAKWTCPRHQYEQLMKFIEDNNREVKEKNGHTE